MLQCQQSEQKHVLRNGRIFRPSIADLTHWLICQSGTLLWILNRQFTRFWPHQAYVNWRMIYDTNTKEVQVSSVVVQYHLSFLLTNLFSKWNLIGHRYLSLLENFFPGPIFQREKWAWGWKHSVSIFRSDWNNLKTTINKLSCLLQFLQCFFVFFEESTNKNTSPIGLYSLPKHE